MIHLRKIFAFSALASLLVIGFACTKPEHEEKKAPQIEAQTSVKISDEEQEFSANEEHAAYGPHKVNAYRIDRRKSAENPPKY